MSVDPMQMAAYLYGSQMPGGSATSSGIPRDAITSVPQVPQAGQVPGVQGQSAAIQRRMMRHARRTMRHSMAKSNPLLAGARSPAPSVHSPVAYKRGRRVINLAGGYEPSAANVGSGGTGGGVGT